MAKPKGKTERKRKMNRPKKDVDLKVRVSEDMKNLVANAALERDEGLSIIVREALAAYFAQKSQPQQHPLEGMKTPMQKIRISGVSQHRAQQPRERKPAKQQGDTTVTGLKAHG